MPNTALFYCDFILLLLANIAIEMLTDGYWQVPQTAAVIFLIIQTKGFVREQNASNVVKSSRQL
jgi:hypothetical protein